jgi:ATP-dependent DNA helicase RecQ
VVLFEIQQWCQSRKLPTDVGLDVRLNPEEVMEPPQTSKSASDAVSAEYYDLFEQELSIEEIAVQQDTSLDTVSRHLVNWLQFQRRTDIGPWVSAAVQTRIEDSIGRLGPERLKPIFEDLRGEIPYHLLKIVVKVWELEQHK